MTKEEQLKNTTTEEFAEKLFDFYIDFHNGDIEGLCENNDEYTLCNGKKCTTCISDWLKTNSY